MNTNHLIPASNVERLLSDFKKLQRKAESLKCLPPTINIGKTVLVEVGEDTYVEKVEVVVSGNAPSLNGWSFIGTIESVNGVAVVRSVPGMLIPEKYQKTDPCKCDHCATNRRRSFTFVVQNADGETKQVGSSCLKDFTGHPSPDDLANYAKRLSQFNFGEYEDERCGSSAFLFSTLSVVAASIRSIKDSGYGKSDSECPTKHVVLSHFLSDKAELKLAVTQEDRQIAVKAVEWMSTQSGNEFKHNLSTYAKQEGVAQNSFGFLTAGAALYLRMLEDTRNNQGNAVAVNDEPIAQIGDKIRVNAEVIRATSFSRMAYHYADSGVSQVLLMRTDSGKLIKMFSSNMSIKVGDSVSVSGKIKEFSVETFERSPFKDRYITTMAPRARITIL